MVHSGNGATRNTISFMAELLSMTDIEPDSSCQSRNPPPPNCHKLTACSNKCLFTQLSLCLFYEYSLVSLMFNYLSQYGCIEAQHMSQTIKSTMYYENRDVMTVSEGHWKLHRWFAAQEVNKVVIYECNNTQIWLQRGEHLGSDFTSQRRHGKHMLMYFRLQCLGHNLNNAIK